MTEHFYARAAARLLAHEQPDETHQPLPSENRASTVAALEREILKLARPRPASNPRVWLAAAAGLALVAGLGVGWRIARRSTSPAADAPPAKAPPVTIADVFSSDMAAQVSDAYAATTYCPLSPVRLDATVRASGSAPGAESPRETWFPGYLLL